MSRTSRKPPPRQKTGRDRSKKAKPQKLKIQFLLYAIIFLLAAIPFSMGKYFEFNSPGAFDSGSNVYSAQHILSGAEIGVEEKPSAALGTLLINMLGVRLFGFNETGPKLLQLILQAAALLLMFVAMQKLFGRLPAAIGVIIASVYLSSPLIAKYGNVKEQFMIAFMVSYVLYQLGGRWWYAVSAGAFLSWAPLFKETGTSALGAIGLFVVAQPILKNRSWPKTGLALLLLAVGAIAAIGPLYIWILGWDVQLKLPFSFVWSTAATLLPAGSSAQPASAADYVGAGRKLVSFAEQWPRVLRYYWALRLPIALAAAAVITGIIRFIGSTSGWKTVKRKNYERFALLFGIWWLLDMAFVWISPRSYEQYYLPLNASAAMLGGYILALYTDKFKATPFKTKWVLVGSAGFVLMIAMSWHIFFGITKSPHSGYNYGQRRRGYAQKLSEISSRRKNNSKAPWEIAGEYIRINSKPEDKIYVWGWYPGIYVKAQRFSSASKAFCMPRPAPHLLEQAVAELMAEFERQPPKFIVDTHKRNIPIERPPYELWPVIPEGFMGAKKSTFLPPDKKVIAAYDAAWAKMLREKFGEDEALRYEALKPFREFVMNNYTIEQIFGQHVLFKLKRTQ